MFLDLPDREVAVVPAGRGEDCVGAPVRERLGEVLRRDGLVTQAQLEEALELARSTRRLIESRMRSDSGGVHSSPSRT